MWIDCCTYVWNVGRVLFIQGGHSREDCIYLNSWNIYNRSSALSTCLAAKKPYKYNRKYTALDEAGEEQWNAVFTCCGKKGAVWNVRMTKTKQDVAILHRDVTISASTSIQDCRHAQMFCRPENRPSVAYSPRVERSGLISVKTSEATFVRGVVPYNYGGWISTQQYIIDETLRQRVSVFEIVVGNMFWLIEPSSGWVYRDKSSQTQNIAISIFCLWRRDKTSRFATGSFSIRQLVTARSSILHRLPLQGKLLVLVTFADRFYYTLCQCLCYQSWSVPGHSRLYSKEKKLKRDQLNIKDKKRYGLILSQRITSFFFKDTLLRSYCSRKRIFTTPLWC